MSVQFCLALLALSSLAAASDPDCEELLKPQEDPSQVYGKWLFYAGTSDNKLLMNEFQTVSSSWIQVSDIPDSDEITLKWGDRVAGQCYTGEVNLTFSTTSINVTCHYNGSLTEYTGRYLVSAPGSLAWIESNPKDVEARKGRNIHFFTKYGTSGDSHLEGFKKQAACLNFPTEFVFGGTTDLCLGEKSATSDVTGEEPEITQ